MMGEGVVVVVDLEKDRLTLRLKDSEVVLLVRVVGTAEIVIDRDRLDDPFHGYGSKSRNSRGYDDEARRQGLTQLVIKRANLLSPFGHGASPEVDVKIERDGVRDQHAVAFVGRSAGFRGGVHEPEGQSGPFDRRKVRAVTPLQREHVFFEPDGFCFPPLLAGPFLLREDNLIDLDRRPVLGKTRSRTAGDFVRFGFASLDRSVRTNQAKGEPMPLKRATAFAAWPPKLENVTAFVDHGRLPPAILWVGVLGENPIAHLDVIPVERQARMRGFICD